MRTSFLQALRLPQDLADEACTRAISGLVSLAAEERPQSISLRNIHDAVSRYECAKYLEPFDVLPVLLSCRHDGALDLIRVCAVNNSPKELMIVIQETVERLQARDADREEEIESDLVQSVIGIAALCAPAISRPRLGKRSAFESCSPLLENIASLVSSASPHGTREQGRVTITEVARLVQSLSVWAPTVAGANELRKIKSLLRELLDTTVTSCVQSIQASLAIRAVQIYFPRVFAKSAAKEGWQDGERSMLDVQLALESLGDAPCEMLQNPGSFSDLVYLAHSTPPVALLPSALSDLHHLLVGALHMNMVVDEALFLLFRMLTHEKMTVLPDVAISLCAVLTALASTHLDPTIRQLNLRLLSLTLGKLPPAPRLEILSRLTTDEDFPQIRGPAVGLLKEAVLEALALLSDHSPRNPFASPELLRTFGGILFKPNPPEFFSEKKTEEELAQSLELLRIADCLSFYYVLLQRDRENKTGVRCKGNVTSVQSSILGPLRRFLDEHIAGKERPLMVLSTLEVGLDRIDCALRSLHLERDGAASVAD